MTDLAETIERLERGIQHWSLDGHLSKAAAEALLATARRVQAMEATPLDGRKFLEEYAAKARAFDLTKTANEIQVILDLASDQSAARARVAELERALDGQTFVLPASFGWQAIETIPDVENCQLLVRHSAGYFALIAQVDGDWLDSNGVVDLEDFTHWTQVIEPEETP
ncbi:MAG TPA: hypothetical protein VGK73_08955 [Polyangiaceae bacterium]